ncbi:fibronectin type III domain-containing protein [Margalitia sp. FSL K6-0131]|uniref:fibronectin type III domain-containing protein n=1 Tax=Margalitia sp. FSL K6-0131 TaxID=2954604 RepID=UPI0030FBC1EE
MADINGVTLNAGSSPTVKYTITYTKSRPNNNQMTYNFTISAALSSSGSYIHSGYALLCTVTVNGSSAQVRIKAADGDNWDGTTPRLRYVSVTCTSTTGNAEQGVRFRVISDGRLTLTSGVIDNSSYSVLSSPLLITACGAPTSCSVSPTVGEGNVTLSWSGASDGTNNSITSYEIQYSESSDNVTWGSWTALTTVTTSATSGSLSVAPPATRGYYRRFQVRTQGSAGASYYSGWKISANSVRKNIPPEQATVLTASPAVYSTEPVTITWSGAAGGTSPIKGYMIACKTSTNNETWTGWTVLEHLDLSASSGSRTVAASNVPGTYTRYGLWTIDTLNVYSSEQVSNSILCVSAASATPVVTAPKDGSATYNHNPRFLISTGSQPNSQVVCVKIGSGIWQDSVNNPELFSARGTIGKNTSVIFRAENQIPGVKLITIRCLNQDFAAPSSDVSRTFTLLPSPFETISANETKVKAKHITALRTAANTVRDYYRLPTFSWSESIMAGKTYVKNWPFHILEIRRALEPVIDLINQFDSGSAFDVPEVNWEQIGNGRPKAAVMNQLQELILAL